MKTIELTEAEEAKRGAVLASMLNLKEAKQTTAHGVLPFDPPRYSTEWGTKTALGLFRTIKRIVEDGE